MTRVLRYGNKEIFLEIRRTKRKKTVALQVALPGKVIVFSPNWLKESKIDEIIQERMPWVIKKLNDLETMRATNGYERELVSGESFPYLGKQYRLKIFRAADNNSSQCWLADGRFNIVVDKALGKEDSERTVREALVKWYCKQAVAKIEERVERYAKLVGEYPRQVCVRNQKKRWGSCSSKGNLSLNWKIVMTPISVFDYIVVHELCHLTQPSHSPQFWGLVESIIPDYRRQRTWLKQNAFLMQMFD